MSESTDKSELVKNLDEEGDVAADYLEELLDIADLDGDIEISVEADRASLAVLSEGETDPRLRKLVGREGEVLEALQELTRLAVQSQTGERSRLMLDIDDFRKNRRAAISAIAEDAVSSVQESGDQVELDPMNPFERKVVHDIVAKAGLVSDSKGVGPARHVVVRPAAADAASEAGNAQDDTVTTEANAEA
ncbi:MAG: protein jag [Ancrocorticia sp.]|uniref:Jag family protein n=1 Tax=Ancrocorticia sp. TaxID=2593684 RepID=UPI003F92AA56